MDTSGVTTLARTSTDITLTSSTKLHTIGISLSRFHSSGWTLSLMQSPKTLSMSTLSPESAIKRRIWQVVAATAVAILVVLLYIALTSHLGCGIPCVFHWLTGLECPSCGATRMCQALIRGDIQSAFQYNGCLLVLSPIILGLVMRFVI